MYYLRDSKLIIMQLLDGKATAQEIRKELKNAVDARKTKNQK